MKFKANTRRRALEYEKALVEQWKQNKTFEKSVEQRTADNAYVFYDGPPFITGVPHHGTLLSSIIKDAVPRYWAMKGKRVERVWGWDSHGLPAENFVEKQLGITDRRDIGTKVSLEKYVTTARDSMVANSETWEGVIDRIGRWVDFKGAYRTMDKNYMESVWWAFKTLYEKGKIYEGYKVLMYDTKFATPVSKNEVTMDNDAYQTVTDPSLYVRFKVDHNELIKKHPITYADLPDDLNISLLAWTTTPWTLPANMALAVSSEMTYCFVKLNGELLIMAKESLERVLIDEKKQPLIDYEIIKEVSGKDLKRVSYEQPVIETFSASIRMSNTYQVTTADFVTADSGTGIVHIAPAYGEDDYALKQDLQSNAIDIDDVLDENGFYRKDVADALYSFMPWRDNTAPLECWEANKDIAKGLVKAGIAWKIEYIQHEYPFNPRSKQRIMYRTVPSWFFDVQDQKQEMFTQNTEVINWFPEHLKHGRFEKNIEQAPDWNLSRNRFWATALPVWKGTDASGVEHMKVIGSYAELKELSGVELEDYHRPWIDNVTFDIDGVHFKRIENVFDGWFESGSMPFAQFHYPFENKAKFEQNFPGDFISEYVAQVRAWFYYVHTVNVGLFGKAAFKNVITTGTLAGNDGRKMSKSLGNYTDPNELMDKFSADSLRFVLLSSPLLNGEDFSLNDKDVGDVARKLSMVWNMYDFFTMYAEVDGWEFDGDLSDPTESLQNPLDQWIVSRVHQLALEVEKNMDTYDIPGAVKPILPFIEDASNWYVRRSRRRFWKSEDDGDKNNAYRTLHYVLVQLSQILAPFTPFLAEELYQKLTGGESVHLLDWPTAGHVNELVVGEMETVRDYVNQALSLRAKERIKIRQPLASVTVPTATDFVDQDAILEEELNVKRVITSSKHGTDVLLDFEITPELKREGLMREVIRHVQSARKNAGLNVDDRIKLGLRATGTLAEAIDEHRDAIATETLASTIGTEEYSYAATVKVEDEELVVTLEKA
ncbi:isoleucine--tRNA ligase [Candidatus Saccharibacteria bacterium]|nr:isoleucine--tRNA ligase [Candidatus Saccharibacteria bacterium]